ncbi:MAG: alkaline phosphatase family protein [Candidatus Limnocylindrales bacterium]
MRTSLGRLISFYALHLRLLRTWRPGRMALLKRIVLTTAVGWAAFAIAVGLIPGISADGPVYILGAVFVIAGLNALLRPVLLWLAVPLGIVAILVLGTVLQFMTILVVGSVLPGIHLSGPAAIIECALLFSLVNTLIVWFIALGEDDSYFSLLVHQLIGQGVKHTDQPGLVVVQIDGLSHEVLRNEIRAGRVPTMSRWVRSDSYCLTAWECRLPSQTSASQAGILFGNNDGIPAFRWYEKATGRLMVSNRPADAAEIEARLPSRDGLLRRDGSSIGNLLSGAASESILTMSRLADPVGALGPTRSWFYFFVSPFALARAVFLTIGEAGKEVWQARRQRVAGIEPRISRGGSYPLVRGLTNVVLRQVTVALLVERILRGVPVIYVDFVDYDEIAHHAGPERSEALDALDGLDQVLGALERVARDAPRPYRFVVLSDHGQSQGATFRQRYGRTIESLVQDLTGDGEQMKAATAPVEPWGPVNALLTELAKPTGVGARMVGRSLRGRSEPDHVALGPGRGEHRAVMPTSAGERPAMVVCASGNLALVYLDTAGKRLTLEEIAERHPRLLVGLVAHEGIGFVLAHSEANGAVALGASGVNYLAHGRVEGPDPLERFGPEAAEDLRRLDAMANVGDLVLNSRLDQGTDEVAAFEELVGSHGGLGGWQTKAFLLHPTDWPVSAAAIVGAPAVHAELETWMEAAGLRPS